MANLFGPLDVEDLDKSLNVAASDVFIKNKKPAKGHGVDVYELGGQSDIEPAFVVFCFFEDLYRVQDSLQETWESYKAGTCDLISAMVITNLAFNLVRRAEEGIISLDPERFSTPRSYDALSLEIFFAESFRKGESLKVTPFDDFIYLPTARNLMKFLRLVEMKLDYPQPVPPFRFAYLSCPSFWSFLRQRNPRKKICS